MAELTLVRVSGRTLCRISAVNQISTDQNGKDGLNTISVFSRRQQRKMKLFFLKASRPLLNKVKNKSEKSATSTMLPQVDYEDVVGPKESCSSSMALMELAAFEEARRRELLMAEAGTPLDSAVDWMLDIAQGAPYEWPMFSWLKDSEKPNKAVRNENVVLRVTVSPAKQVETTYPRCVWPRQALAAPMVAPETSTVDEPEEENLLKSVAVVYPRCSWPREEATLEAKSEVVTFPRCEWPRKLKSNNAETGKVAPVVTDKEVRILERIYASESNLGYPHCAWPRKTTIPTTSELPESPVVKIEGPRCAWPRKSVQP